MTRLGVSALWLGAICLSCFGWFAPPSFAARAASRTKTKPAKQTKAANCDQELVKKLAEAGEKQKWTDLKKLWSGYTGKNVAVYAQAMKCAYACGMYRSGAFMYRKLRGTPGAVMNEEVFYWAMRLFMQLWDREEVHDIWKEVQAKSLVSRRLCSSRLKAAEQWGDMVEAAATLDDIVRSRVKLSQDHFVRALLTCRSADPPNSAVAGFFLTSMLDLNMIPANKCIRTYLTVVLGGLPDTDDPEDIVRYVNGASPTQMRAAHGVMSRLKDNKVPLPRLVGKIYRQLCVAAAGKAG
mmetsp:Transcript_27803/g.64599  ORF Transcript_27803/g.64599 Transcript_27803/m.64599 type:complete len:295 (-) Transcript_27803:6-890(-)